MNTRPRSHAQPCDARELLELRTRYRAEMNCQIVHDSIHRREGWTNSYLLTLDGIAAGFGSIAIGGPWIEKPVLFEFYLLPPYRTRVFDLFETLIAISGARHFEIQSSDVLLLAMVHAFGQEIVSERIVFRDHAATHLLSNGATMRCVTPVEEIRHAIEHRQGGGEWVLEKEGVTAGKGGILFHYNRPYGDIYMEISEGFRQQGYGAYLVQELKRVCYELGAIPGARCNRNNIASRRTLQRAGFIPCAHILVGTISSA
jgi:GNAT superfamily N-acetyltransferase